MTRIIRRILLYLAPALWFTSCPADLDVPPAYVTVEAFDLLTADGQGAATTDIREVWAFADDDFLGVFPLPARIPVFRLGSVRLRLEAGIRQDGRSVTPDLYPFYTPVEQEVELQSGATLALGTLGIEYRPETVFGFVEGFEPGTQRVFSGLNSARGITVQRNLVRSGAAAGAVELRDTSRLLEVATDRTFTGLERLPVNVWIEVDYLSDAPGIFGVIGQRGIQTVRVFDPGFLPRTEWTKVYFNLSSVIASAQIPELRIALSLLLDEALAGGTVYLDNIKLLYLPPQ